MDALTQRLSEAAEALAGDMPAPDQVRHAAEHARRVRRAAVGSAAAALLLVLALGVGVLGDGAAPQLSPAKPPGLVVGTVPVWYDAAGLHRGDVVEQTAVNLLADDWRNGQLALVRSGALYRDTATNDVWFHPWGGEPRVVGRDSGGGPGGDPQSDIAAWFEDDELVVYDTASGRELSRPSRPRRCRTPCVSTSAAETGSGTSRRPKWCGEPKASAMHPLRACITG